MALTKEVVTDKIEVLEDGTLQVRTATRIIEDGVKIAETYHRATIPPGQDASSYPAKVREIAGVVHKPDVVARYKDKLAKVPQ